MTNYLLAIASNGDQVSQHFGHCEKFTLFTVENNVIIDTKQVANPGHKPGFLPKYLKDLTINTIISGGMGASAIALFNEANIEVVTGHLGAVQDIAKQYIGGQLKSTGSVCHEHAHADHCH